MFNIKKHKTKKVQPFFEADCYKYSTKKVLFFSPYALAKLKFICGIKALEVGGYGITKANNPLHIVDFALVKQKVSMAFVSFDPEGIADYFEDQVILKRKPEQFARIWIHTHPGGLSSRPSPTDEITFKDAFGICDWSVMLIMSQGHGTYARLHRQSVKKDVFLRVINKKSKSSFGKFEKTWTLEYEDKVEEEVYSYMPGLAFTPYNPDPILEEDLNIKDDPVLVATMSDEDVAEEVKAMEIDPSFWKFHN